MCCLLIAESAAVTPKKNNNKKKGKQQNAQKSLAAQRQRIETEIKQAKATVLVAQKVLAVATQQATAAQGKGAESQRRVHAAMATIESSKAEAENASEFLDLLKEQIESSQSADSGFGQAKASYDAAEQRLLAVRDRVLSSPDYKSKCERAIARGDRSGPAAIANEALNSDAEYHRLKIAYDLAKKMLGQERAKLLEKDSEWRKATADARQAHSQLSEAQNHLRAALLHKTAAAAAYRKAAQAGTAAKATIQRNSADLKRLEQKKKDLAKKQQNAKHSPSRGHSSRKR